MEQIIKTIDNDMTPRFGHTLTLVCKTKGQEKAILFGGVTGSDNHYSITYHTYAYYLATKKWVKLNRILYFINLIFL